MSNLITCSCSSVHSIYGCLWLLERDQGKMDNGITIKVLLSNILLVNKNNYVVHKIVLLYDHFTSIYTLT